MLTQAQARRFHNVSERIFTKAEATFGKSAEDAVLSDTRPSMFLGEACFRELSVISNGLEFNVRVSVGPKA